MGDHPGTEPDQARQVGPLSGCAPDQCGAREGCHHLKTLGKLKYVLYKVLLS